MKILAILFFCLVTSLWYYFSWKYLSGSISNISNNSIITLILLAGMFVFGVLFGKLLSCSKNKEKKLEEFFGNNSYTSKEEKNHTHHHTEFLPDIEKIPPQKEVHTIYNNYHDDSLETKDNIDIILDEKEDSVHNDFSHFEDISESTLNNVAKKMKRQTKENLQIIEGVGPKIEELLNEAGIYSYKDLSLSKTSDIKHILNEAGPRYSMHNPSTWARQAKLASEEKFIKLQSYQDSLIKGVEK